MSWETLVVGSLAFKSGTPEEIKLQILEELEEVLETTIEYDARWQEWKFEDVNWTSHVSEEKIRKVYNKWRPFFTRFSVSLYYLSEADYSKLHDAEDQDAKAILEGIVDSLLRRENDGDWSEEENSVGEVLELLTKFVRGVKDRDVVREVLTPKIDRIAEVIAERGGIEREKMPVVLELIGVLEEMNIPAEGLKKTLLVETV